MNVFVPYNAKVRVFVDQRGNAIIAEQNIIPGLKVDVVVVPDGKAQVTVADTLPDSLPYAGFINRIQG